MCGRQASKKSQQQQQAAMPAQGLFDTIPLEQRQQGNFVMPRSRFRSQMYRTEMCRFFTKPEGCPKGAACGFAHSLEELNSRPDLKKTSICRSWAAGKCSLPAEQCGFAHGDQDRKYTALYQRALPDGERGDDASSEGANSQDNHPSLDTFATSRTSYPHVFGEDPPGWDFGIFNDKDSGFLPPPPPQTFKDYDLNHPSARWLDGANDAREALRYPAAELMPTPFMKSLAHQDQFFSSLKSVSMASCASTPGLTPFGGQATDPFVCPMTLGAGFLDSLCHDLSRRTYVQYPSPIYQPAEAVQPLPKSRFWEGA
mmetsp:Transcript_53634/g.141357  ORF Transcript_53634/g.141357 Transcript_53634/m.141357 type:complete len:313 (-) Transcript_53634:51-989(-)